jgi:hypothetical protein
MNLDKLDKRMIGYGDFQYSVHFSHRLESRQFYECRGWCVEQWGRAPEIDIWQRNTDLQNPAWSWERGEYNKTYRCRLFLASDKEAHWFTLRWL